MAVKGKISSRLQKLKGTELSLGISPRADVLTQEDSAAGASEGFMLEGQGPDSAAVSPRSWCFPEDEGGFSLARNGMKGGASPTTNARVHPSALSVPCF